MATYIQIASVTVGAGGAASMDFTSIPQTYTDLVVKLSTRTNGTNGNLRNTLAGITSGVYSEKAVYGTGSSAASFGNTSQAFSATIYTDNTNYTASTFANSEWYIPNYTSANNKSFSTDSVVETNGTAVLAVLGAGLMANTSAVTSISIAPISPDNFVQYSTATLYGISKS
jgi:hypothetical protein